MKTEIKNRTGIDFSEHELQIVDQEGLKVYQLKKPNTICESIKYINTNGIMAVTGDFGNWIFCREFHPSPKERVSSGYWIEKLQIHSVQEPLKYDSESTAESIKENLNGGLEAYGYEGTELEQMKEYFENCLQYVDDETEYLVHAREYPGFADYECVVYEKKPSNRLLIIMDGFDEICQRMKSNF